jgi:glycosyltransferase involved in cell wall biosynthesis
MAERTIIIAANAAWNLVNFRAALVRALIDAGYRVVAAAPPDPEAEAGLASLGCEFVAIPVDSRGLSPIGDMRTLLAFYGLFRRFRPVALLGYTIKPNVYGSLAARLTGVRAINNISGLGTAFIRRSWLTHLVKRLYRAGLARSDVVFFQNTSDRDEFLAARLVSSRQARLLPGSGIDGDWFAPSPKLPDQDGSTSFLLIARLLRDKGVVEYVEAARALRRNNPDLRFRILGFLDVENRTAISRATVEAWVAEGTIEFLGASDDVRPYIAAADCIVLPSYREGTSRVLLEASAMARPVVATDVPGCREVVDDGITGFLCAPRDAADLAEKLARMAALSAAERTAMGQAGRTKIMREFDQSIVIGRYLEALGDLAG